MNLSMCEVILYQEHYPTYESIEEICKRHDTIKLYCFRLHDKDLKKDGSGEYKKPHYHVYLHFGRSQDTKNCERWFSCADQDIQKIKGRWEDGCLYACHLNDPTKHLYSIDEVRCNFNYAELCEKAMKKRKRNTIAQDLANSIIKGEKTYRQAFAELQQYDYTQNGTRFLRDAYNIFSKNAPTHRNVTVVLIYGASASGKTALAQELCKVDGIDYCLSGSGTDPLSDYMGERALILDDIREGTFTFTEWLKLLDPFTGSPIRSRYSNKIFTGDIIYMTTSQNPLFWFLGSGEERWQFFRRIKAYIVATNDTVTHYDGFIRHGNYVDLSPVLMTYKNPISLLYPQEKNKSDSYATKLCNSMSKIFEKLTSTNMEEITDMEELK